MSNHRKAGRKRSFRAYAINNEHALRAAARSLFKVGFFSMAEFKFAPIPPPFVLTSASDRVAYGPILRWRESE